MTINFNDHIICCYSMKDKYQYYMYNFLSSNQFMLCFATLTKISSFVSNIFYQDNTCIVLHKWGDTLPVCDVVSFILSSCQDMTCYVDCHNFINHDLLSHCSPYSPLIHAPLIQNLLNGHHVIRVLPLGQLFSSRVRTRLYFSRSTTLPIVGNNYYCDHNFILTFAFPFIQKTCLLNVVCFPCLQEA